MKCLAVTGLLVFTALACAQFENTTTFDMAYRPFAVLQRGEIKKELKLTKDQSKQIDTVFKEFNKASRDAVPGGLSRLDKADADLISILDDAQKQRYSELDVQNRGATALSDAKIAEKLELTADQKASIKRIRGEAIQTLMSKLRARQGDMSKLMEEISKAEETDLLALLNETQREAFSKMAGAIFKGVRTKGAWPI